MTATPWGPVGYLTYKRTYARKLSEGTTEEFTNTVSRVVNACRDQLNVGFTVEEEARLTELLLQLKGAVAGRFWWQLGTTTVDRLGMASLQNCAGCVVDDPVRPFVWAMDMLMLGAGVGYNIQRKYVYEIKQKIKRVEVTRKDNAGADFIVPDTREGWCKLLGRVLKAHFYSGESFTYSTHCVRGNGAPISSFGGTASGAEILCKGIGQINKLLNERAGRKLQPIDALDIMNIIGSIVVAGNVRRSAQLAVGDYDDLDYLKAKNWSLGTIPNWRAMSNNSVDCADITLLPDEFWAGYQGGSEPYGIVNLELSRNIGRLGETQYPDSSVMIFNPCVEQPLEPWETCCLAEVYLPNIENKEQLFEVVQYLYRICKHSLSLRCHNSETDSVVHKNYRMGIGLTGVLQATEEQRSWADDTYKKLRDYDIQYSKQHGFPVSVKLTTCKPSGTLSLLAGVTPGIHPGFSQYFIRRIRIAADSNLVQVCKTNGYPVEYVKQFDGTDDRSTVVVEFPCSYPDGTVLAKDLTAVQQLEYVKWMQTKWSDNGVSCTVYYKSEELPEIKAWLADNYHTSIKAVSFLLHTGHGFAQAPYEEITEEEYLLRKASVMELTDITVNETDFEIVDCEGGACPVK
jgi:ribonucleoside-triphosphate reductase